MSKQNKEINHNFNIGDIVFVLKDYAIIPCVITGVSCNPLYGEIVNGSEYIDKNTTEYTLIKIKRYRNKDSLIVSTVSISEYDKYSYHNSKVYANVDDLLSDLEKTTEIP